MALTLRQFVNMLGQMNIILELELGSVSTTTSGGLTGEAAHKVALRMFGKGKK